MKKYTFQMTKEEVREFWFKAKLERWRSLPVICLVILVSMAVGEFFMSRTGAHAAALVLATTYILLRAQRYIVIEKELCESTRTMWAEDGKLKIEVDGELYDRILEGKTIIIRNTPHLLMIGFPKEVTGWYPIPLRAFGGEQERKEFLETIDNMLIHTKISPEVPVAEKNGEESINNFEEQCAGESEVLLAKDAGREYFHLFFQAKEEEWVKIMQDAEEVTLSGTIGEARKRWCFHVALSAVDFSLLCLIVLRFSNNKYFTLVILFLVAVIFGGLFEVLLVKPEESFRNLIRKDENRDIFLGVTEIKITEMGIWESVSGKKNTMIPWEKLSCIVETETELFFYKKENYTVIPKWCMENREQIESLKELCREKQVEILAGKRKRYAPKRLFSVIKFIIIAGTVVAVYGSWIIDIFQISF